jgi:uncharacterized protein YwqG
MSGIEFPSCLKEFERDLQMYKLSYVEIKAIPLQNRESTMFAQNKFLGKPNLPVGAEYPRDKTGKPMILLAQLNFAEIPKIEDYPEKGFLQFFVSADGWYDMDDYEITFYENIVENQTDFSFLTDDLYAESPIQCEHKLRFLKKIKYGGAEDFRFDYKFDGLSYYDFAENLDKTQRDEVDKFFDNTGHKIGGYADFMQGDPRERSEKKRNDISLLQIDIDDRIMFGDSGLAHLFINKTDLRNKNFEKAYFYWDCC